MITALKNNLLIIIGFVFFSVAISIHNHSTKPAVQVGKQETTYNLNRSFLQMISIGNKRMISNIIWIQTLLESDQEKYTQRDYANWMYLRFLTIATLDPMFYENYLYGGMYLSVIKDDLMGAAHIFDLGIEKFPDDYRLNYYSGFNYFFEMGDFERGYRNLVRIKDHPKTPPSLKLVINKLAFETSGDYETAINFLKETLAISKDEMIKDKVSGDLYAVTAERDLACLNSRKENCNLQDTHGHPYIRSKNGTWISRYEFKPYKIFRPSENPNP